MNLCQDAVKTRLRRARALLREKLHAAVGPLGREIFRFAGERCQRMWASKIRPAITVPEKANEDDAILRDVHPERAAVARRRRERIAPARLVARTGALGADITERWERTEEPFREAIAQLGAYFQRRLRRFDLALAPEGTPFERDVWSALREIPYGETVSYSELARRIGRPAASRAVGAANGKNPIPIIVPCHRVIGANGSLTGFGGGLGLKRRLLDLEAGASGTLWEETPEETAPLQSPH